jgi:hypothetical protein
MDTDTNEAVITYSRRTVRARFPAFIDVLCVATPPRCQVCRDRGFVPAGFFSRRWKFCDCAINGMKSHKSEH